MEFKKFLVFSMMMASVFTGSRAFASKIAIAPKDGVWLANGKPYNGATDFGQIDDYWRAPWAISSIPGRNGYFSISAGGWVTARGDAAFICGKNNGDNLSACTDYNGKRDIDSIAATPDGKGFWAVDSAGYVHSAGTAKFMGHVTEQAKWASIEPQEIISTPTGNGYYVMMSDGGVFVFGDAKFFGSTKSSKRMSSTTLSYDASGHVNGYWMQQDDGGVFALGNAVFHGSTGGKGNFSECRGLATMADSRGYVWQCKARGGAIVITNSRMLKRVKIVSADLSASITVHDNSTDSTALLVAGPADSDDDSNMWDVYPLDRTEDLKNGGLVQLVNVRSRMCMNVSGASYHEMIQFPCQDSSGPTLNDRWKLEQSGGDWILHPLSEPDTALMATGAESGDRITVQDSSSASHAHWLISRS